MNRIDRKFQELRQKNCKGFIAYITAGDPTLIITEKLISALEKSGVGILELGVPFSDPMADGLTNQKSAERALNQGTTLKKILVMIKDVRKRSNLPIVLFTYLNPVFRYGWEEFAKDAAGCGVDGVLLLDLPVEESKEIKRIFSREDLYMIYLLAPTSSEERIKFTCKYASGFIYYVSRTGVTGIREFLEKDVRPMVEKIKMFTNLPIAVGFGISRPEHVKSVWQYADAVVVGSAIVSKIEENIGKRDLVSKVAKFVGALKSVQ